VILPRISISRPVLATMMSVAIVLFGIISLLRLPVRELPDIDPPIVSITTFYRGASPSVVETEITNILEEQLATLAGVKTLTSSSVEQGSVITVEFELERPVDEAANEVRDKVSRVRGQLPREADDPIVSKVDANAQAIMWIGVTSTTLDSLELTEFMKRVYVDRLSTVPGVANVIIGGERRYAMRIWIDRAALAARGLTVQDVETAVKRQNVELPGGLITSSKRELTVKTDSRLATPDEFAQVGIHALTISEPAGFGHHLQLGGGFTARRRPDSRDRPLERVCRQSQRITVAFVKRAFDAAERRWRILSEQVDHFLQQLPIAAGVRQCGLFVERRGARGRGLAPGVGGSRAIAAKLLDGCDQVIDFDWFGQIPVHAGRKTSLTITSHRMCGQGDDRQVHVAAAFPFANLVRCLEAAHLRHLQVHEHNVKAGCG